MPDPTDPKDPRVIPIDPYVQALSGNVLKWEPPPAAAAPMSGENSVLRLHVPAEQTELDFGAGKTPGIRMATDNHAHMTARHPLTTISLGAPGGDGIGDAAAGLQVFTDGQKFEHVKGAVRETYGDQKIETVEGAVWETYKDTKKEIVQKDIENEYHGNKKETIAQELHVSSKTRSDTIDGDWTTHVTGQRKEQIDGDRTWLNKGKWVNVTCGAYNDLHIGEKLTATFAANITLHVGATISASMAFQQNFVGGNKHEVVLGTGVTMNQSLKVTVDNIKADKAMAAYKDIGNELKTGELEIFKKTYGITSSQMTIFK
jgi:hypothetical protein